LTARYDQMAVRIYSGSTDRTHRAHSTFSNEPPPVV
jgi:hypothetical protein